MMFVAAVWLFAPFGFQVLGASEGAQAVPQVGKYQTLELVFTAASSPANPFDTYLLKLEVTDPTGVNFNVEGFYDGDGRGSQTGTVWKARLCPYRTGTWQWKTVGGDAPDTGLAGLSGQFTCVESGDPGGLVAEGRYFRFQDGDYLFPVGNFLDQASGLPLWSFLGEETTDAQRDAILARQRDVHDANKYMFYLSNHSDASDDNQEYVTPWPGDHASSDKTRMDLVRWKLYDGYLQRMKDNGLLAYMSIFEDGKPGNYGDLPEPDRNRLLRYVMARTSAYSHMWYVLCFEWREAWTWDEVNRAGEFLQAHNPWKRLVSVHDWAFEPWEFSDQSWPTYVAAQCGNNETDLVKLNDYVTSLRRDAIPVLADEFGILTADSVPIQRSKLRAVFCGGAAGVGTGSELKAFQRFLAQSRVPFQRMAPSNGSVEGGGATRFCLAEEGHHWVVYSRLGSFTLKTSGTGLKGFWFNPRDANGSLGAAFDVPAGTTRFTPPDASQDWVLWVADGQQLNGGVTHPSGGGSDVKVVVGK
jgi:Domain of unknown function (DUF5060)